MAQEFDFITLDYPVGLRKRNAKHIKQKKVPKIKIVAKNTVKRKAAVQKVRVKPKVKKSKPKRVRRKVKPKKAKIRKTKAKLTTKPKIIKLKAKVAKPKVKRAFTPAPVKTVLKKSKRKISKPKRVIERKFDYIEDDFIPPTFDACHHEHHINCVRCGMIQFTIGLVTGVTMALLIAKVAIF